MPLVTEELEVVAHRAVEHPGIESAAIFVRLPESGELSLGAAAGVSGPPLDRLVEAVQDPAHPIAQTLAEGVASYDVTPVAPGGPALRSHVPLVHDGSDGIRTVGVLAVAHEHPLDLGTRRLLVDLSLVAVRAID